MKLIEKITQSAMRNRQIVLTITVSLMLFGLLALKIMPRRDFPEFHVRQGLVVGVYPGATSEEVEEQLTNKVEEFLFSYEEVDRKKTNSISEEGMMYIFVEVRPEVEDPEQFWATLRLGLNELKGSLPQGVLALIGNNKFGDASALLLTMHSEQRSPKELEEYLNLLETELRKLPSVSAINTYGLQREEISIYLDNEKMAFYGINPMTLLGVLRMEGMVSFSGEIDNGEVTTPIHLPQRYSTETDLAQQIIYTDPRGVAVRLKDVARVVREYKEPSSYIQVDGNNCVLLSLEMMGGNNIVKFGDDVDEIMARVSEQIPPDVQINTIADQPLAVKDSVNVFLHEFLVAILAVIIVTMVLLPFRVSSVAAMTIPISILIALGVLYITGVELHTVSLAALIIVLGMVVDNTIVIVDNYVDQLDSGVDAWSAAWKSVSELFVPILSATLAIIAVFVPMNMFLTGVAGDFVQPFPATITITLAISLLVAVLLVPIMTFTLIKTGLNGGSSRNKKKGTLLNGMQNFYNRILEKAFKHKMAVILGSVGLLLLTGLMASNLPSQFGPVLSRSQFAVEIYLTEGTSLDQTEIAAKDLQEVLLKDPRVEHVTAFIGTSSPRFHTMYAPQMPSPNYAQLVVNTTTAKAADEMVNEYYKTYVSPIPQAHCKWKQIDLGAPNAPIQVKIAGDNLDDLKKVSAEVKAIMNDAEGMDWVRTDFLDPKPGIRLVANDDEANRLGLTKSMIAYTIASSIEGIPLTTVWEGDYPVSIVLKQSDSDKTSLEDLGNVYIASPFNMSPVRSRQVVKPVPEWTEGQIVHYNGVRTLTVRGDIVRDLYTFDVFQVIQPQIDALDLPEGVSITYGGEHEMEIEYYTPFVYSLATSIVVIFFILLFQFRTIRLSLIVMSIIPFVTVGAVIGLLILGFPFGMTSFISIISVVGMIIRNGIIYVDYAEHLRTEKDMSLADAAIAAGKRRMRPIFLTSTAAAVGVIPMILSGSPLWAPMGTIICFGLLFAMVLSLIVLPIVYALLGPKKNDSTPGFTPASATAMLAILVLAGAPLTAKAQSALTLEQSKSYALENNVEVKNSIEELKAAKHTRAKARTSWFPSVSAMAVGLQANDPLVEMTSEGGDLPVYDGNPANLGSATQFAYFPSSTTAAVEEMYMGAVTATQPLFVGGRILNGNRLASLGVDSRELLLSMKKSEVIVHTEQQYWQLVSLDEKLKTISAYEEMLLDLRSKVKDSYESGLTLQNDLLKVELKLSEVKLNKSKLINGKQLAMMAFCQYIGIPYDSTMQLDYELDQMKVEGVEQVDHRSALEQRDEHQLLQQSVKAAKLQKAMAVGENLPSLALGYSAYHTEVDDMDPVDNSILFVTMEIPISSWWGGGHEIAEKHNQQKIAENNQMNSDELLLLQMDKAWKDYIEARDQLTMSELAKTQADMNLDVNNDAYNNGVIDLSDLLEAQALQQEANDRLIEARINLRMSELYYLQATDRLN